MQVLHLTLITVALFAGGLVILIGLDFAVRWDARELKRKRLRTLSG